MHVPYMLVVGRQGDGGGHRGGPAAARRAIRGSQAVADLAREMLDEIGRQSVNDSPGSE